MATGKHQIVIVGGGSGRISRAARLLEKRYGDVAVIEPCDHHESGWPSTYRNLLLDGPA